MAFSRSAFPWSASRAGSAATKRKKSTAGASAASPSAAPASRATDAKQRRSNKRHIFCRAAYINQKLTVFYVEKTRNEEQKNKREEKEEEMSLKEKSGIHYGRT